jgi:uncharacterized protein YjiS (DUF1127 family)
MAASLELTSGIATRSPRARPSIDLRAKATTQRVYCKRISVSASPIDALCRDERASASAKHAHEDRKRRRRYRNVDDFGRSSSAERTKATNTIRTATRSDCLATAHFLAVWKRILTWSKYRRTRLALALVSLVKLAQDFDRLKRFVPSDSRADEQCNLRVFGVSARKLLGCCGE